MFFFKRSFLGLRTIILVILALALMIIEHNVPYSIEFRSTLLNIVAPVQYVVSWPIMFMGSLVTNVTNKKSLLEENAKLKAQQLMLQAKVQKFIALEQENSKLRGLVESASFSKDKFLIAQLLAVNSSDIEQQIVLDKGKLDGVFIGQPVLDAYGLVGQVILASMETSVILLITDEKSAIPVQVNRNGVRAIAIGAGDGSKLELVQMPETVDIKEGDLVITSGLGSRFPQGYPVGTIAKVKRVSGEHFLKILVAPTAHIDRNHQFLLIWPARDQFSAKKRKLSLGISSANRFSWFSTNRFEQFGFMRCQQSRKPKYEGYIS